ncbi:MAG: ABC transporter permease [Tissierellia bacterium]|nr:ABC transporter permease [Tissierellia bacterium]
MKKYILMRLIRSIISILIVVSIVVAMLYTLVPTSRVFEKDTAYQKLKTNYKVAYQYSKLEELGYLDYMSQADMCIAAEDTSQECLDPKSEKSAAARKFVEGKGFKILSLDQYDELQGTYIAYRYYNVVELVGKFFTRLIEIDNPWAIKDEANPGISRKYYFTTDHNGIPALACSGCNYKYQIYFDGNFPFIHQNIFNLNFGDSFPTQSGIPTTSVIGNGQGKLKSFEQTFPTGQKIKSPILQHTCKYKENPDHLDKKRFTDNYANCTSKYESASMIQLSYLFGILAIILAYSIAVPAGVAMARNKGKLQDKIGIVYINILISVPSLAFIFFVKFLGHRIGLPDKFPHLGFNDVRSYILPVIILGLLSTPSLMMWIRRYMVDQANADYVKFAKAKGLTRKEIARNHIFKNAIIPIVNGIPASIILAISGAVITESVFSIPGMGKMLPDAILNVNNNMVITLTFIFSSLSIFSVFLGDILMTIMDPRISLSTKKGA